MVSAPQKKAPKNPEEGFDATVDLVENYAIFTLDLKGFITSWNKGAANIKGYSRKEVLGKFYDFLYLEEDRKKHKPEKNLEKACKEGTTEQQDYRLRKNGEIFLADITMSQIHDEKTGKHIGYIKVVKDITKQRQQQDEQIDANTRLKDEITRRKNIEKALKESNAELEAFAQAASHDLQEPLRMVISYLQLIERRYSDRFDQDGKEFLEFAVDGASRMKILVSDLVEYARLDTMQKPFKPIDTDKLLLNTLSDLSEYTKDKNVTITYDKLPPIIGDQVQLGLVFQNLIANAIKFSDKDRPVIHIGAAIEDGYYVFCVRDNGKGIPKKDFSTIFHIFKQLGNRTDRKGSGVGLAIAKKVVIRHRGKIWVDSQEGKGSTFYFTIPLTLD